MNPILLRDATPDLRSVTFSRFARRLLAVLPVVAALAFLSLSGRAVAAEPWPDVALPPKGSVQWVAQAMRINGVPTSVMQFQSQLGRGEVADYYRDKWSRGYDHVAKIHTLGDSTILSQEHGSYLMTVKIEDSPRGASHGLISVALLAGAKPDHDPGILPMLPGARVTSVIESEDAGKHSRQVMISTSQQPASVSDFYESALVDSGWRKVQGTDAPGAGGAAGGFFVFSQGAAEVQLSIIKARSGQGSTVLANIVTRSGESGTN